MHAMTRSRSAGCTLAALLMGAPTAFADALAPYCTDPALRHAHGDAGARKAGEYGWDRINQAVIDTYLRLAKRG